MGRSNIQVIIQALNFRTKQHMVPPISKTINISQTDKKAQDSGN
jgi:hypothetical protein